MLIELSVGAEYCAGTVRITHAIISNINIIHVIISSANIMLISIGIIAMSKALGVHLPLIWIPCWKNSEWQASKTQKLAFPCRHQW